MKKTLKIGLVPRGLWTATAVYAVNDTVQDATGLYASRKSGNINNPLSDSEWWVKIVDLSNVKHAADDAQAAAESAEQINQEITNAEVLRVAEENARKTEEHARKTAESGRESAEQRRLSAEAGRETAEEIREQAEGDREVSEEARQQAEQSRAANYETLSQAIQSAEVLRESAEQSRERAESDRASAENSRETAEQSRELAEGRRQKIFEQNEVARNQQVEEKVEELTPFAEKMNEVTDISRDFGKYNQLPDVALTPVYTGKRFNSKGELVDDVNWNVGRFGQVERGLLYELFMGSEDKMVLGTALFVSHTIEKIGSTNKDVYTPVFSAMGTRLPISTYAVLWAGENYEDLLVSYRNDVEGANIMKSAEWGLFKSIATQYANLKARVDLKSFADGYYQSMRVGLADNLTPRGIAQDFTLTSRVVPSDIVEGNAVVQSIKGNSVVWNQAIDFNNRSKWSVFNTSVTILSFSSEGYPIVSSNSDYDVNAFRCRYTLSNKLIKGHIYVADVIVNSNKNDASLKIDIGNLSNMDSVMGVSANIDNHLYFLGRLLIEPSTTNISAIINTNAGTSGLVVTCKRFQVIDLTQMFGAGNEPTTYTEFLQRKPQVADEYAYNEGEIINNMADEVKTTGRNLWDGTKILNKSINNVGSETANSNFDATDFIEIIGGKDYYIKGVFISTGACYAWYDNDKNFISSGTLDRGDQYNGKVITAPANARYIRVSISKTLSIDVCINISDPAFNGQYEPYKSSERLWKATREKYFPNGLAKVGNVADEMTITKAVKRVGVVEFDGTEKWKIESYGQIVCDAISANTKSIDDVYVLSITLKGVSFRDRGVSNEGEPRISISPSGGFDIRGTDIQKSDKTVDDWKQYLRDLKVAGTPLTVYYALATTEEVEYDELNLSYPVTPNGLEEMIAEGDSAPLSMSVVYGIDAYNSIINNRSNIGNMANLATTSKADLVSAINELKARIDAIPVATSEE